MGGVDQRNHRVLYVGCKLACLAPRVLWMLFRDVQGAAGKGQDEVYGLIRPRLVVARPVVRAEVMAKLADAPFFKVREGQKFFSALDVTIRT